MGTDGIEIAQQHRTEVGMCCHIVGQNSLDHDLGPAVGAGGLDGRHFFLVGMGIVGTVDRRGGGENKLLAVKFLHHFQQGEGAVQIVAVVLQGLLDALAHCLKCGKVNDRIDFVGSKNLAQCVFVLAVQLVKSRAGAGDGFNAIDDLCLGIGQIIHNDGLMACLNQFHHGMAADITGAAGNQYIHS